MRLEDVLGAASLIEDVGRVQAEAYASRLPRPDGYWLVAAMDAPAPFNAFVFECTVSGDAWVWVYTGQGAA